MSSFTTNLNIEQPVKGAYSGQWGGIVNSNYSLFDQAICGVAVITLPSAGTSNQGQRNVLPITQQALSAGRNVFIEFIDTADLGATAYVELTPATANKVGHFRNSLRGGRSIVIFQSDINGNFIENNSFEIPNGADVTLKFNGGTVTTVHNNLTVNKITATNFDLTGGRFTSNLVCGQDSEGLVGFSLNDGGGNANIVFNCLNNDENNAGFNSARISHNTDAETDSVLSFKVSEGGAYSNDDKLTLDSSGNLTATGNVTAYSDARLKDRVETLDGSKVYKMRGVSYFKGDSPGSGVIAQELLEVAPELVNTQGEYFSVAYGNLVGYLIEAVKQLKFEIEELKNGTP